MTITELIIALQSIVETHGNIPVLHGDMFNGVPLNLYINDDVAEPEKYPKGFLLIGDY